MPQPNYHDGGWHSRSRLAYEPDERLIPVPPKCLLPETCGGPFGQPVCEPCTTYAEKKVWEFK